MKAVCMEVMYGTFAIYEQLHCGCEVLAMFLQLCVKFIKLNMQCGNPYGKANHVHTNDH